MAAPRRPIPAPDQPVSITPLSGPKLERSTGSLPDRARRLSHEQRAAIRAVMQIFVEDDLAGGMADVARIFCDSCRAERPAAGFIRYDQQSVCNACAVDYEIARAEGRVISADEYVRARTVTSGKRRAFLSRVK